MASQQMTIALTLSKQPSALDGATFYELVDYSRVKAIIEDEDINKELTGSYTDQKNKHGSIDAQLKKYMKNYDKSKKGFKVLYKKPQNKWGRVFPQHSLGLTTFKRKIRNTLLEDNYIDIDIVNAHPCILHNICEKNNISHEKIKEYIGDRSTILLQTAHLYNVSVEAVKELYLRLFFLGSFDAWAKDNNVNATASKFIKELSAEIQTIAEQFKTANEILYRAVKTKNKKNPLGSMMSTLLQEWELRIMEKCIHWLTQNIIQDKFLTYEYDGLKLPKRSLKSSNVEAVIRGFEKCARSLGFDLEFKEKKIEKGYDLEMKEEKMDGVRDDKEAAEVFLKLYPYTVSCKGDLYMFIKNKGLWSSSNAEQRAIVASFSDNLHIIKEKDGEEFKTNKSYGNDLKLQMTLLKYLESSNIDNKFIENSSRSTLGKLLFSNGYYDFRNKKFVTLDNIKPYETVFFAGIDRKLKNLKTHAQQAYKAELIKKLFHDPLGVEMGDYLMVNLARGLAGDMMKRVLFGLGGTNCGKSVFTTAMLEAFSPYAGTFNATNLSYNNNTGDEASKLRWALLLKDKRLIFSNEIKSTDAIDGNSLKKISSGGDELLGRTHCKEETSFLLQPLSVIMANDLPKIQPYDDAVDARVRVISYKKQFVDDPKGEDELKADRAITNQFKEFEFKNTLTHIMLEAYNKYLDLGEQEPEGVQKAKEEWIDTEDNAVDSFLEQFEITGDANDYVVASEVTLWIKEKLNNTLSSKKMMIEVKKYCKTKGIQVGTKTKKISGKVVRVWTGIKSDPY